MLIAPKLSDQYLEYHDSDLQDFLENSLHSLCFKSNTVKKRLVSHFEHFLVVA